jgi:dTDP-glucose pyrophosphorylase
MEEYEVMEPQRYGVDGALKSMIFGLREKTEEPNTFKLF